MKNIFNSLIIIIVFISLSGCRNKYQVVVEQVQANNTLSVSENYKEINGENVLLRYPLEFVIKKNNNVDFILLYLKLDNNLQSKFSEYRILDYKKKPMYDFEKSKLDKDLKFTIIFNYLPISKGSLDDKQLFSLKKLQKGDSLIINKKIAIINDLNKRPDSLIIRAFSKNKLMNEKRLRINW